MVFLGFTHMIRTASMAVRIERRKNMINNYLKLLIAGCILICIGATPSAAVTYKLTIIGTLGGDFSAASDINEGGQIVGSSFTSDGFPKSYAFLWENGEMTDLGPLPEDSESSARSINNEGAVLVVGISGDASGPYDAVIWEEGIPTALGVHGWAEDINDKRQIVGGYLNDQAWLWDGGTITYLGTLVENQASVALKINNSTQVVGFAQTDSYLQEAFIWEDGNMNTLENLPGPFSQALSINELGIVVGRAGGDSPNICYPFVWENGSVTWLGDAYGSANDINNKGQVVGQFRYAGEGYHEHAFVWDAMEGFQDLNDLLLKDHPWVLDFASAINESGQIVGTARADLDEDGDFETTRGFLLTPIPTLEDIRDFFHASMLNGKVEGNAEGWNSYVQLWMFGQLLESATFFIDNDMPAFACEIISRALSRCDGEPWPMDLIKGEAVPELKEMIILLMNGLDCDGTVWLREIGGEEIVFGDVP
jgi:probable HAF family extracellular repeat protein